jgi:hypothetical protein
MSTDISTDNGIRLLGFSHHVSSQRGEQGNGDSLSSLRNMKRISVWHTNLEGIIKLCSSNNVCFAAQVREANGNWEVGSSSPI